MGRTFLEQGHGIYLLRNYEGALSHYNRFLTRYPDSSYRSEAWYWKAKCLQELGRKKEAVLSFERVLQRPVTAQLLGLACLDFGKMARQIALELEAGRMPGDKAMSIMGDVGPPPPLSRLVVRYRGVAERRFLQAWQALNTMPEQFPADELLFYLCRLAEEQNDRIGKDKWYVMLKARYPQSSYAHTLVRNNEGGYTIQVAKLRKKQGAQALLTKLRKSGFTDAFSEEIEGYYHIRVGHFDSFSAAVPVQKRLRLKGYKDVFVTRGCPVPANPR